MSARIHSAFEKAKQEGRSALIPFIMGGDPDAETSAAILKALPEAGADIIEIGIPFSDPMADGPVIQAAGLRARANGATLVQILKQVQHFRKHNQHTPIILMGYANPFAQYGMERFAADARAAGADGTIIVDVPPEEEMLVTPALKNHQLELVRLIAPPSLKNRLPLLTAQASGYLYLVSIAGITGSAGASADTIGHYMQQIRQHTNLPVAVGFGIKTPDDVAALNHVADGIVVGSAIVKLMENAQEDGGKQALELVSNMARALHQPSTKKAG